MTNISGAAGAAVAATVSAWRRGLAAFAITLAALFAGALMSTANAATCTGTGDTVTSNYRYTLFNFADAVMASSIPIGQCRSQGYGYGASGNFLIFYIYRDAGSVYLEASLYGPGQTDRLPIQVTGTPSSPMYPNAYNRWIGNSISNGTYVFTVKAPFNGAMQTATINVTFSGTATFKINSATITGSIFSTAAAPEISTILPAGGPAAGGNTVVISGTDFTGASNVTFGGTQAASVTVNSASQIAAVAPAGALGPVPVVVTTPVGSGTKANGYNYVGPPALTSITSDKGVTTGSTIVTISGSNLIATTGVTIGGAAATDLSIIGNTSIQVRTPAGTLGAKDVVVTTSSGSATLAGGFTYLAQPAIVAVSPAAGPTTGGQVVTITGSGFAAVTSARFFTSFGTSLTVVDDNTITLTTPARSAGVVPVIVHSPVGMDELTDAYTFVAAPTLTAVSPSSGLTVGGTSVTLTGTNLTGATAVTIDGVAATAFTVNSATQITATTPTGTAGAADIVVTTLGGTATLTNGYTYVAAPTLASISPSSGILIGGQTVTLTGTNLTGATAITIGGTAATSVNVVNDTTVTAVTPAGTAGAKDVVITTPGGNATLTNGFTYAAPPLLTGVSPSSGPTAGGTTITLTGTNLTGATAVVVGGALATGVTVVNATTVTAIAPARPVGTYNVAISTPGGGTALANAYTYVAAPTLTAAAPNAGPTAGGTSVTLTGTNLTGSTSVTFGGVAATGFTVVNATTITATTPAATAGAVDIAVTTAGGNATLTGGFTYVAAPTLLAVSPDRGPVEGGQVVTLTGTNFTGATAVAIAGAPVSSFNVQNDTTISLVTAAATQGPKSVVVTTPGGNATLAGGYTYVVAPQIFSLTTTGFTAGGDTITINGTGFSGATAVTFNGVPSPSFNVISPTQIEAISPPGSVGYVTVLVISEFGIESSGANFLYRPKLLSVAPSAGPTTSGQVLTITGEGFTGLTGAKLGNIDLGSFVVVNDTTITAVAPALAAAAWPVSVLSGGLQFSGTPSPVFYTVQDAPGLSAISPNAGPVAGGTSVTLTGTNLSGATAVTFGGVAATGFTVVNATTITATTPAATAGAVDIAVTTAGGNATLTGGFTYLAAPTLTAVAPNAGSPAGGQSVTITGTNLTGASAVTFDGAVATFNVVNGTTIAATTPAGSAGPADVAVTTSGGTATLSAGYTYGVPLLALTAGDLAIAGDEGGANWATTSSTTAYTVENTGSDTLTWSATLPAFLSATPVTGTLQPGETVSLAPAPNAAANALSPGVYTGAITVTSNGGTETRNVTLTVGDATAPVIATGPANIAVNTAPGSATAVVTYVAPTFTDNVGVTSVTQIAGLPSGAAFPVGITTNTFRASDAAGNTSDYSFTVTVGDNQAPVLANGPANITVNTAPGSATAVVTYVAPTFTDNVGVTSVTQIAGLPSGAAFPVGITTNTFRASDAAGNTTDYSFTVTVGDNQAPVLANGPANITVNTAPGSATAVVTYTVPTFTDNVGVTSITQIAGLPSGASFPVGITTNTFRAGDAAGNATDFSFTVTVADAEPPVLANVPANITINVDFPATSAVATWTPPTATDNAPGVTVTRTAGPAPGSTFPLGATTITYRAADTAGNTADASFTVTVSQTPPGSVTVVVNSGEDGIFGVTSNAPGLSGTIATSGGTGSLGPVAVPQGSYTLAFTTPAGFGVASASCTAGGTLNAASQTGTLNIASNAVVICTITTVDSLGETAAALGGYLETRASLVVQNAPEVSRRLDRLTGGGGAGGGISGFGVSMGTGVLPFSMSLGADELTFSTSLIGASRSGRTGLQPRQARSVGESIADPLGDHLFGLPGDRLMISSLEEIRPAGAGAATGDALGTVTGGDNDPMAQRFDIWVEGRFARFDAAGGEGTFGILHFGADYLVTPNLLLGVGLQFDWLREDTILGGDIDGQGYLAGPYLTARLAENLYLDLRAAWGTADTEVSPFGTYVDTVESDRMLITGALIGDYRSGGWTIRPEARLTWYREETDAYTDSLNVAIPAMRVETGYLEFGPELGYVVELAEGASLRPNFTFQGVWTFAQENTAAAPSNAPGLADTGLRGRAELGLAYQSAGFSLAIATYYDGIGDSNFEAWGGRIKFNLGF